MGSVTTRTGTVVGVFENSLDARQAIQELLRSGFTESQIGVVSHDFLHDQNDRERREFDVEDGAAAGATAGLGLGMLWGLAILAGVIPGIGPAIAGGTLGVLISSAVTGAATVGLAGALIGLGISEETAAYYEEEFHAGHTIVTVEAGPRAEMAWAILAQFQACQR